MAASRCSVTRQSRTRHGQEGDHGNEVTGSVPDRPGEAFVRSKAAFGTCCKNDASYEASSRGDFHTVGRLGVPDAPGLLLVP